MLVDPVEIQGVAKSRLMLVDVHPLGKASLPKAPAVFTLWAELVPGMLVSWATVMIRSLDRCPSASPQLCHFSRWLWNNTGTAAWWCSALKLPASFLLFLHLWKIIHKCSSIRKINGYGRLFYTKYTYIRFMIDKKIKQIIYSFIYRWILIF